MPKVELCAVCGEREATIGDMCDQCWNDLEFNEEQHDRDTSDRDVPDPGEPEDR